MKLQNKIIFMNNSSSSSQQQAFVIAEFIVQHNAEFFHHSERWVSFYDVTAKIILPGCLNLKKYLVFSKLSYF